MPRYERIDGGQVTFAIAVEGAGPPRLLHFGSRLARGADLSALDMALRTGPRESMPDKETVPSLLPTTGLGWQSSPAVSGTHDGHDGVLSLTLSGVDAGPNRLLLELTDARTLLHVSLTFEIDPVSGVLASRVRIHNGGRVCFRLALASSLYFPLPGWASELLAFNGDWSREGQPHRIPLTSGSWSQTNRTGRTGFPGATFAVIDPHACDLAGRVLAFHLAWSGNHQLMVETMPGGRRVASAAALLAPGEIELAPGEHYETPTAYACFSDTGLNGVSDAFHPFVRNRILPAVSGRIRRVHFNSWEAAYFAFDEASLKALARTAAELGVERFVLDDGWFEGRRDDTSSLGDWRVDKDRFPGGLAPLIDYVGQLGMDFGLWVEPEMVNPSSDLYRRQPDWCLHVPDMARPTMRNQLWLDMSREDVRQYIFEQLDRLLSEYAIAYLKWDCNRFQFPAASAGRPASGQIIRGSYALIDRLRDAHPHVEIESCASGGGRIDLEILKRAVRVWPSDTTDAVERTRIQRWASLVLPPETIGAHIGPSPNPVTGRMLPMDFRARVAMFGHLGIELDPRSLSAGDHEVLGTHINLYKQYRQLIHSGRQLSWRSDDDALGTICISVSGNEALALVCRTGVAENAESAPVRFPGLDRDSSYLLTLPPPWPAIAGRRLYDRDGWLDGRVLSGEILGDIGLWLPLADPHTAWLIHFQRRD